MDGEWVSIFTWNKLGILLPIRGRLERLSQELKSDNEPYLHGHDFLRVNVKHWREPLHEDELIRAGGVFSGDESLTIQQLIACQNSNKVLCLSR